MNEFSEIYLNTFYIGVTTTEIKLLRSSKTLNPVQVVYVHADITYSCPDSTTPYTAGKQ